jgi:hypothetical protein
VPGDIQPTGWYRDRGYDMANNVVFILSLFTIAFKLDIKKKGKYGKDGMKSLIFEEAKCRSQKILS